MAAASPVVCWCVGLCRMHLEGLEVTEYVAETQYLIAMAGLSCRCSVINSVNKGMSHSVLQSTHPAEGGFNGLKVPLLCVQWLFITHKLSCVARLNPFCSHIPPLPQHLASTSCCIDHGRRIQSASGSQVAQGGH